MRRTFLSAVPRLRFEQRRRDLIRSGWVYFPETTLFVEKVSVQAAKWSPTAKPRFLPNCRRVYEREVFQAADAVWRAYLEGHPLAISELDAAFRPPPTGGGLWTPNAVAVHDDDPVRSVG